MSSALAPVRHEAAELVELMRRQGVHQALNQAILTVYVSGTNAPSEMLDEILHQLGRPRVPPVPEKVRLPLRAKDDFIEALRMCNLQTGLTPGVQALDAARRSGHRFDTQGEAVGVLKDKAIAWHTARKQAARKRVAAATAVVLDPPPQAAQQKPAGSVSSEDESSAAAAMADADAALEAAEAAAEAAVAEEEAAAAASQDE